MEPVTAIFMTTSTVGRRLGRAPGTARIPAPPAAQRCPDCPTHDNAPPSPGGRAAVARSTRGSVRRGSVERVAAGAGAGGVRVVDGEALGVDPVSEVDLGTGQV